MIRITLSFKNNILDCFWSWYRFEEISPEGELQYMDGDFQHTDGELQYMDGDFYHTDRELQYKDGDSQHTGKKSDSITGFVK